MKATKDFVRACKRCGKKKKLAYKGFCTSCNAALGAAGAIIQEDENKLQSKTLEDFAKNPKFIEIMRKLAENPAFIEKMKL